MPTEADKALRLEALKLALSHSLDNTESTAVEQAEEYLTFLVSDSKPEGITIPLTKWVNGLNKFRAAVEHFGVQGLSIRQSAGLDQWFVYLDALKIVFTGQELERYDEQALTAIIGAWIVAQKLGHC